MVSITRSIQRNGHSHRRADFHRLKKNPIQFPSSFLHTCFFNIKYTRQKWQYGMKIFMAQKWSWKNITYSTFELKKLSNGSVYMVSYNDLKNFIQLNEKRIFQALSFDEKFQNFRVTCAKCILVCCSATRKKNQDFITLQFFQVNKSEEHCWDFLLNFKLGKICYQRQAPCAIYGL